MNINNISRKALPVFSLIALSASSAQAQFIPKIETIDTRDKAIMRGLENYMTAANNDHSVKKLRQGPTEDKPLGNYFQAPYFAFKSEYAKLSTEQQAQFAYDLNQYRKTAGLDWETIHTKPVDWKYMPYEKQSEFARYYWLRNSPEFKTSGDKDRFIYESLIDATSTFLAYKRRLQTSADTVIYGDSAVQHLIKKEP